MEVWTNGVSNPGWWLSLKDLVNVREGMLRIVVGVKWRQSLRWRTRMSRGRSLMLNRVIEENVYRSGVTAGAGTRSSDDDVNTFEDNLLVRLQAASRDGWKLSQRGIIVGSQLYMSEETCWWGASIMKIDYEVEQVVKRGRSSLGAKEGWRLSLRSQIRIIRKWPWSLPIRRWDQYAWDAYWEDVLDHLEARYVF